MSANVHTKVEECVSVCECSVGSPDFRLNKACVECNTGLLIPHMQTPPSWLNTPRDVLELGQRDSRTQFCARLTRPD